MGVVGWTPAPLLLWLQFVLMVAPSSAQMTVAPATVGAEATTTAAEMTTPTPEATTTVGAACVIPVYDRSDCGFNGITTEQCRELGCCIKPGENWCYHALPPAIPETTNSEPEATTSAEETAAVADTTTPDTSLTNAPTTATPTTAAPTTAAPTTATPTTAALTTAAPTTAARTVEQAETTVASETTLLETTTRIEATIPPTTTASPTNPPTTTNPTTTSKEGPTTEQERAVETTLRPDVTTGHSATEAAPTHGSATQPEPFAYTVSSILIQPFLMMKENVSDDAQGNDRYEGYMKDYLDAIGLPYALSLTDSYGSMRRGEWTGIIGEVASKRADIGAAPLVVTVEREQVVDFTWPVMSIEAVVVLQRRASNQRLTVDSWAELVEQNQIKLGIARNSPIAHAMQLSDNPDIVKAWQMISLNSNYQKENNNKGFQRVRQDSQFAFIVDSVTADWVMRAPPCDLVAVPTGFFQRQYAFAIQDESHMRDKLNEEITRLEADGIPSELYEKWWGEDACGNSGGARVVLPSAQLSAALLIIARLMVHL